MSELNRHSWQCEECPRFVRPGVTICTRCVIRKEDERHAKAQSDRLMARVDAMIASWDAEVSR